MAHTNTTTAIKTLLASALLASGIGALTPGGAGAAIETPTQTSTTTTAPARQESTTETTSQALDTTVVVAETAEQLASVHWALGRFETAGLELPTLAIYTHSDRADCNGLNGYLANRLDGGFDLHTCGIEFTLLHELAHAWDNNSLTEDTKDEFLRKAAQATTWNNAENWFLAGGEHAANVIAWGLGNERINQTRTRPYDHNSMLKGFEILTGGQPLWLEA
jgi:hypothetical protein